MNLLRRTASLLLFTAFSLTAAAQPVIFGDYAPLTNTRYGTIGGTPELVSNGRDVLLFWSAGNTVRAVRLADGERRVSQVVLEAFSGDAAVTWTGQQFLVAATADPLDRVIVGRLVDAAGQPLAEPFRILANADSPRLASNGRRIVMVYNAGGSGAVRAAILSETGREVLADVGLTTTLTSDYDVASNGTGFSAISATASAVRVFTFDRDGNLVSQTSVAGPPQSAEPPREVAIASDGDDYLAVWTEGSAGIRAADVTSAGTAAASVTLDATGIAGAPDAIWAGDHFEVAYRASAQVRLLAVRGTLPEAQRIDNLTAVSNARVSLAHASGRTLAAWNPTQSGIIHVRDTHAIGDGEPASYGAADQLLLDSATSPLATLFVWSELSGEGSRFLAGVRHANGDWTERQFAVNLGDTAFAATNGSEFLIVASDDRDWLAVRVDAAGNVIGPRVRILPRATALITDLAWNGRAYVVAGRDTQGRIVAGLLGNGAVVSPLVVVREPRQDIELFNAVIASDGTNTLVAWQEIETHICFPICDMATDGINYRLVGPNLELLGESPRMIVNNDADYPNVVYANGEFVVVWRQFDAIAGGPTNQIRGARIDRAGRRTGPTYTIAEGEGVDLQAVAIGDRIAVSWHERINGDRRARQAHVQVARTDGVVLARAVLPPRLLYDVLLAALPGGRVAHAIATRQSIAPHHGASRILVAVSDTMPVPPPGAPPRLFAIIDGINANLSWTPAPGEVNGYRIEYRVADGAWLEIERWVPGDTTSAIVRLPRVGTPIGFRVRAFNDGGAGSYSPLSGTGSLKRRSVR